MSSAVKRCSALIAAAVLAGCASAPKENIYSPAQPVPEVRVDVASIAINDVSTTRKTLEFGLGLGFDELPTDRFDPPPGAMLRDYARRALVAAGSTGLIEITILSAGFYVKRELEDRLPIVNLFAFGRTPRPYMCDAVAAVKSPEGEVTQTLRQITPVIDPTESRVALAHCQMELVRQLSDRLAPFESQ